MTGVCSNEQIMLMVKKGEVTASLPVESDQIQPASLDLRLGDVAYRMRASFLPGQQNRVNDRLADFMMHQVDLSSGAVLEKGCVYLVPLAEKLKLPDNINAVTNAKSSTGRVDLLTRTIVDNGHEFDSIHNGYEGPLYAEIYPRSFSVKVRSGLRLNQIRFRCGASILSDAELRKLHQRRGLMNRDTVIDQGIGFSVDLEHDAHNLVGYRAKPHTNIIDLDKIGYYNPSDYWDFIYGLHGKIILDPGAFYILVSREFVQIPPKYAAEMAPYLAVAGEFRVHYAGFFDPGFGYHKAGGHGSRAVLEVRCHEVPFVLNHGQVLGRLVYEHMAGVPTYLYGQDLSSNYQGQGLKLSKHFKTNV
ncbi:MAG: 2'-deoxycytidine 5'-triphosphate deaminase [Aestuariivita sp.]|nr:2'-deoxycytidine 5'-triphosphate deaminase [Aestuariivita sp.]